MSKFIYKNCAERKDCWLGDPINSYLTHLKLEGHSNQVLRSYSEVLASFAFFLREQGVGKTDEICGWVESFGDHESNPTSKESAHKLIIDFVSHLQKTGVLPKAKVKASPFSRTLSGYETFLREIRGLKPTTIAERVSYCAKFLKHLRGSGVTRLRAIKHNNIETFVVSEGKRYARKTMVDKCSVLRKFLSYLYSKGTTRTDLSAVIAVPRLYKHERCPRFLNLAEIEHVLASINRSSAIGKRDYSMLLMLTTYGLRSVEVIHLRLEDIDWRTNRLYIRKRKPGNSSVYPLSVSVGNAIVDYLKNGRPENGYRSVFLSHRPPYRPFKNPNVVQVATKKYMHRAGFEIVGIGAHIFRYSCAQRLFEDNFELKVIGDYLGHRDLDTTRRYMKIDITHLREVALNCGEDLL